MNIENEVLGGLGIEDRTGVESTSMATTVSLMRGWQSWIQHREINLSLTMRKKVVVVANREIYNHEALKACLKEKHDFDCEVLAPLYKEAGEEMMSMLDDMYSFVLLDTWDDAFIAARDPIGITPLYMGHGTDGSMWFTSEMKALKDNCQQFQCFSPGHICTSKTGIINLSGFQRPYHHSI